LASDGRASPHPQTSGRQNTDQSEALAIEQQLNEMRSRIRDLGHEIDTRKAAVARSMGGAVLLFLLGAGAAYDLITRNSSLLIWFGVTPETLTGIALGCGLAGAVLLAHAIARSRVSDQSRNTQLELARLEQEYADLLERMDSDSQAGS